MQVYKCPTTPAAAPAVENHLTFDQMMAVEGIYQPADDKTTHILVLVNGSGTPGGGTIAVDYYGNSLMGLNTSPGSSWRQKKFIKVNKKVCFELRSA